ncbi:ferrous iron transport protein A [Xylanimonas allomyrinae]|uniref:Ferrous iron transport protein A n=1 Tax=Xylanimonas allomyrinae TaxID=2509459 RepID=A0A4P6EMA5_9MICO|nr:ferrous iron transport protein A [Xylanimonas allomyrinae]QAY62863.1 ferrous iron transport protein A [Xylanimonas allomyrinae]
MDLRLCPAGTSAEVRWVDLDDEERTRLRELGLREGAVVHVVHCGAFGSRVVAVGADRFAIDGRTCACIGVDPLVPQLSRAPA